MAKKDTQKEALHQLERFKGAMYMSHTGQSHSFTGTYEDVENLVRSASGQDTIHQAGTAGAGAGEPEFVTASPSQGQTIVGDDQNLKAIQEAGKEIQKRNAEQSKIEADRVQPTTKAIEKANESNPEPGEKKVDAGKAVAAAVKPQAQKEAKEAKKEEDK